jgi:hypothetical protein
MAPASSASNRRLSRDRRSPQVALVVLLTAFAHLAIPLVHLWELGWKASEPDVVTAAFAQRVQSGPDIDVALHAAGCSHTAPGPHHDDGTCLVCRTLQRARYSVVSATSQGALHPHVERIVLSGATLAPSHLHGPGCAPRAPPALA